MEEKKNGFAMEELGDEALEEVSGGAARASYMCDKCGIMYEHRGNCRVCGAQLRNCGTHSPSMLA